MTNPERMYSPEPVTVTDLGKNNTGSISCADIDPATKEELISNVQSPEYRSGPTKKIHCIDGRLSIESGPGLQIAGGLPIAETAVDMMIESRQHLPKSQLVAQNTRTAVWDDGLEVFVHGDDHSGKAGCGANKLIGPALEYNAKNVDVVHPTAWFLGQQLGLDKFISEDDVMNLISNGYRNSQNQALWDVSPEEAVDIAVENGARYEEMKGAHNEKVILVDNEDTSFDKKAFIEDHTGEDGKQNQAFVASLGAYKKIVFGRLINKISDESGHISGFDKKEAQREAAMRMMGIVLFHLGVAKQLTAEEQGNGEALPVVVLGQAA